MLQGISWQLYAEVVGAVVVLYYVFVGFTMFRKGGIKIFTPSKKEFQNKDTVRFPVVENGKTGVVTKEANTDKALDRPASAAHSNEPEAEPEDLEYLAHALRDQIKGCLDSLVGVNGGSEAVMASLRPLFLKHGLLKGTVYEERINQYIDWELEQMGSIRLRESDKRELWRR